MMTNKTVVYGETTLPLGIRSRFVNGVNGLTMHERPAKRQLILAVRAAETLRGVPCTDSPAVVAGVE
jgi:hypothetical protein